MHYLHNSEVSVHGKLRSCNCLIDGRFVLKITDFGLTSLTTPLEIVKDEKYHKSEELLHIYCFVIILILINFLELLWVAPELLPLTLTPGIPATPKGDVYSFGIILEEIIIRGGPYEAAKQFLEAHGKIKILKYLLYVSTCRKKK